MNAGDGEGPDRLLGGVWGGDRDQMLSVWGRKSENMDSRNHTTVPSIVR
jgi:hypothetical protein